MIPNVDQGHLSYDFRLQEQLRLNDKGDFDHYELQAQLVEEQMLMSGLPDLTVRLLMDKFVSNLSYDDIAIKYAFKDRHAARRFYKKIIGEIKSNKSLKFALKQCHSGLKDI